MAMVFDIETDGLYPGVSLVWILTMEDTKTGEQWSFSDYDPELPPLSEGLALLKEQKIIAGHNIIGFDLVVLKELLGWVPDRGTKIIDTWILSQMMRWKRGHNHGLEGWGKHLGHPKQEHEEWDRYSPEMRSRCETDVTLNVKVYNILIDEVDKTAKINPLIHDGIWVEMRFAAIEARIRVRGWEFDMETAVKLRAKLKALIEKITQKLEPKIGMVCVAEDSKKEFKTVKILKDGRYDVHTAKWFGIDQEDGKDEDNRIYGGGYCRITYQQGKLSSDKVLKAWLFRLGWVPDEYNFDYVNGRRIDKGPKLTDSSLEPLGEIGKEIIEFNTVKNRHGILNGWIEEVEKRGRLHGRMWCIGTPTMRCRHEVVANMPALKSDYGPEMRGLLITSFDDTVLVGADSSGNQMRGLCHYIGNQEFTDEVVNGDVHKKNLVALDEFIDASADTYDKRRDRAKRFLYALLFGSTAGKSAEILMGSRNNKIGAEAQSRFADSVPGLKKFLDGKKAYLEKTQARFGRENGFVRGLDGRILFCDQPRKVLMTLLQAAEGLTCKAAAVYLEDALLDAGIRHEFLLHYHDELVVEVHKRNGEKVKVIAEEAFSEAPKWFGVECMGGKAQIGLKYSEIH
jgi:DNA polymerase I